MDLVMARPDFSGKCPSELSGGGTKKGGGKIGSWYRSKYLYEWNIVKDATYILSFDLLNWAELNCSSEYI